MAEWSKALSQSAGIGCNSGLDWSGLTFSGMIDTAMAPLLALSNEEMPVLAQSKENDTERWLSGRKRSPSPQGSVAIVDLIGAD